MLNSLLYRITRAGACWHWVVLIPVLAVMVVTTVLILSLSGCAASSYSANWLTSTSTLCQSCHGTGEVAYVNEEEIVTDEKQCVEPTEWMRANHMNLVISWREEFMREGKRTWTASDGKEYDISLTGTCLKCHGNKEDFCDQCHTYAGVSPPCWTCHNEPETGGGATDANQ